MKILKQSTAAVISFGPFLNPGDGVTLVTSLVSAIDHASTGIMLSKNGGAFAVRNAAVTASTYDAYGNYRVTLDTTDTATLGRLRVQFAAAASCLPVWDDFMIVPANIYDSLVAGSDVLDASVTQLLGTAWLTPAVAGTPDVTVLAASKTGYSIGTGGIAAAAFGAGAIDAAAIAANAIGASELAQDAAQEIADEVLNRDIAGSASGGARNVRSALRAIRNKVTLAAGTLTVYQEDDATSAWTAAVTTTAGNPISAVDP